MPLSLRPCKSNPLLPYICCLLILLLVPTVAGDKFNVCLNNFRDGQYGPLGGTDNHGRPVSNITNATAITYDLCVRACGSDPEGFRWPVFSQQFSSWLLPWLALVSQLPFGSQDKLDNLVSMLLTLGSPTLAAYSLALTALNGRWIAQLFASHTYPNAKNALKVLSSLQQSPLSVTSSDGLLASLIILPQNDDWWSELLIWLDYTHTWSIAAVTSISWVVIAYIFTVINSFAGDITESINANGEGVGSLWLWLLPIVTGWLQISPKCESTRLRDAIKRANEISFVATDHDGPVLTYSRSGQHAISLYNSAWEDPVRRDELCTAPIYNYSRFLPWVQAVEKVSEVFRIASIRAQHHQSVDPEVDWEKQGKLSGPLAPNRVGTLRQVKAYCESLDDEEAPRQTQSRWGRNIWSRVFLASLLALLLQWGTTGAAIIVVWFTPTSGLGCRSGAYILYGCLSTVVWILLVFSSFLSHYSSTASKKSLPVGVAGCVSIILRRVGKCIALVNAIWIVMICVFQFSNFFNRCYCNSSVLGWGSRAFNVIDLVDTDTRHMRAAWIGGVALAAGTAAIFTALINLFINPQFTPDE
ncbi:hypothetical protein BDZ94DRAFT_1270343 [Collybia nuda]|uniref:Uncharacterized protein n=1 Tax=Collybia nuda TaxID=64659 RepID=A0A9P6CF26_9AGAR|nr:hypothetical protein BDZ94DRAFT_1270343 [Collybia nuda]